MRLLRIPGCHEDSAGLGFRVYGGPFSGVPILSTAGLLWRLPSFRETGSRCSVLCQGLEACTPRVVPGFWDPFKGL